LPFATLEHSPLAGGAARIHYREFGAGRPLIFLHSGWGYEIYPLARQLPLEGWRIIAADRSGYGKSTHPAAWGADFHRRAAEETFALMDSLGIRDAVLWGHSDGSVIAAWMAILHPERCRGLVLEAFHYARRKERSREFFHEMREEPDAFGERVSRILAEDHGEPYWRELLYQEGKVWLDISGEAMVAEAGEDLYHGRFGELKMPVALLHGACDQRTDEGELEAAHRVLPGMQIRLVSNGEHCPHHEGKACVEFGEKLWAALGTF
jgi:pimeloyl-ACP methyl ester carboxylesterase